MDEIVTHCDRCGKEIPHGSAFVSIQKSIEQIQFSIIDNENYSQVIDASLLYSMCGSCGNKFDSETLIRLIELTPSLNDKLN